MGCASSKDVTVADVYRPPPTSVSLFDISTIEEPWLIAKKNAEEEEASDDDDDEDEEEEEEEEGKKATTMVPLPLLEKLDGYDLAPASWSEVSKALEDIKPTFTENTKIPPKKKKKTKKKKTTTQPPPPPPAAAKQPDQPAKTPVAAPPPEVEVERRAPPPELTGRRVVKDNPFMMRDRESKGSDAAAAARWRRRDPFEGYPERRPPGPTGGGVVLYTTTLRGVRRTFEDCERARQAVDTCAEAVARGEACGGSGAKDGRGCEGCGGARFVPCWECGGSCKVVVAAGDGGGVERCGKCNENGLMLCPICH
uniref:Glutaredoxin domain-containing protein n=1 Tax=Leersia perrieri TaxID=77586 RepID=A0A0D9UYK6_9ORYZ